MVYTGFVTLTDRIYDPALNDSTTSEYIELASSMKAGLETVFCDGTYLECTLNVTGFRNGSVITDFSVIVVLPKESEELVTETKEKVWKYLDTKMSGLASLIIANNITVTPGTFTPGNF